VPEVLLDNLVRPHVVQEPRWKLLPLVLALGSAHLQVERVRLVDQRRQRSPAAPSGQFLPQVAHAPGLRSPLYRAHRCHAKFPGQQLRQPGRRRQNLGE
jgi:hypothetical protein